MIEFVSVLVLIIAILLILSLLFRGKIIRSLSYRMLKIRKRRHELNDIEKEVEREMIRIKTKRLSKNSSKEIPIDMLLRKKRHKL
ncbi:hypothetical protein ACFLQO_00935 [Candidatus Aenigmatarchaeota archaeon]